MVFTYERSIPEEDGWDIVVAGGGPAGTAAAVCAARLGAKVLIIEGTGCLGGMGTSGLVCAFDPMADGKRQLVRGFQGEILEKMYSRGFLDPDTKTDSWRKAYHSWTHFHPEGLKLLLDELVTEAGVEARFFTNLIDANADPDSKAITGIVTTNIEGLKHIKAKTFIDCTGDAILANLAGAECRTNPEFMPGTLCSVHAGIDWDQVNRKLKPERLLQAIRDGHFTQPDRHLPGLTRIGGRLGYLNGGHLFGRDALTCAGRSDGMMLGRRLVREYVDFYRKYMPGCENLELVITGALMGVRETRRIVGEYQLNFDDYIARRQFPDQIGVFNKFVDIHVRDCSEKEYQRLLEECDHSGRLDPGECFGLPYRILVPKGWQNLWAAGRCASSDVKVHGSIRVMPAAGMMGQAAGTAAVQAMENGETAAELDTVKLVETLREQGAYLPQPAEPAGNHK